MPSRLGGAKTDPQARENGAEHDDYRFSLEIQFFSLETLAMVRP
jgi:hypothetical protein